MSFSTLFSLQTALSMVVGYAWFLIPGLLVQRWAAARQECRTRLLFAPLVGLATFGTVSVLLFNLAPIRWPWLLAGYLTFNAGLWRLGRGPLLGASRELLFVQSACGVIALLPCAAIYPFVHDGALYTGSAIHDHARVAFIDAIYRHGLPPVNPIFAPGQDVVFNYYYLWLFEAAQLRALTGVPGWPADVALTWLTFLAVTSACAGVALELARTRAAAWTVVVLSLCGPLVQALPQLRELGWAPRNGLATAVGQASWSPHHVLAAGAIVLALHRVTRAAGERGWGSAFELGCLLACAFGCSVWLAVGLSVSAPLLMLAIVWCYRERWGELRARVGLPLRAAPIAIVLCVPVLLCAVAGPFAYQGMPLAFDLHRVFSRATPAWLQFASFWVYAVPLAYGACFVLGVIGVARGLRRPETQLAAAVSLAAIVGFLLVTQLIRSVVMNNDLGWRAHTVANLALIVWSGVAVDALLERRLRWRWLPIAALIALGVVAAPWALPGPAAGEVVSERAERQRFLVQARAWEIVRRHAGPGELVQSNPYAFNRLSPWPLNLGHMLFADRRSVFVHPHWVQTYAHNLPPGLLGTFERIVRNAFAVRPDVGGLRSLRDGFRVKVLLMDRGDAGWESQGLDRAGVYQRVHGEGEFRVYVGKR